ncbi:T9SS type A sorting domain-containing protein [Flavivirga aquimarina]|uniref:T9SS type A sorting domain-containing protein n=1 Tax=Flavivirga aquimarina TaxID=2027862 RepID=A0ABT8WGU6_9FLAO|nr:T9SS type A sorting domain-containing protein [Flavivirga aquimarina]MDO5972234.1 T9SS type A sorting domain-containing protein [Flavivirga aquimarina]
MKRNVFIIIIVLMLFNSELLLSQTMLREIPLKQQIENSSLVVEGKVISKKAFRGIDNNIYTSNTIEIYKVFKGEPVSSVEVITKGGTIGLNYQIVTHSLKLNVDDLGMFTLFDNNISVSKENKTASKYFSVYSSLQGFYKYNLYDDIAVNFFNNKKGITNTFYQEIIKHTKSDYKEITSFDVKSVSKKLSQKKSVLIPTAISFSPTTVSAGTKSTITITIPGGASGDFGSTQGKVSFRNADSGGEDMGSPDYIDALDTQVTNWTSTSITVEVPSEAGTGNIRVTDANSNIIDSSTDLTVTSSELNGIFELTIAGETNNYAYPTRHVDNDGSGGYIWQMETSFDADIEESGAKAAFLSALETWRCETGVNFTIGDVTPVDVADLDETNVIRFDNGSELPAGTLGQTSYSFSGCGTSLANFQSYPTEIDIVFDDGETWYYGSGFPGAAFDFESVALHELGHAHQLGHVIDTDNDVMHFNIGPSEQLRVLSANNIIAANNVQSRSESSVPGPAGFSCFSGKSSMSTYNCGLSVDEDELESAITIFPNPAKEQFFIKNASFINLEKAAIYDVSGRLISEYDTSNTSRTKVISLAGISNGIYFVNIHSENAMITKKIVIK